MREREVGDGKQDRVDIRVRVRTLQEGDGRKGGRRGGGGREAKQGKKKKKNLD